MNTYSSPVNYGIQIHTHQREKGETIIYFDAVVIYILIKLPWTKNATSYFTKNSPETQQSTINIFYKCIGFGTNPNLLVFREKHFKYKEEIIKYKGSEIGGYESSLLADQVAFHLFEKCDLY